jgi:predicted transcriptional regulator
MSTAIVVSPRCPKTGKKSYPDESSAVQWEEGNRAKHNGLRQFAYACAECSDWHLTTTPPGNNSIARVNYDSGVSVKKGLDTDTVVRLRSEGMTVQQIADEYNVSLEAVKYHLRKADGKVYAKPTRSTPQLMTYEQYNARRVELEAELVKMRKEHREDEEQAQQEIDRIRQTEDRLFEAKQSKIGYGADGVIILRKYDREFDLTKEELAKLFEETSSPAKSSVEQVSSPA